MAPAEPKRARRRDPRRDANGLTEKMRQAIPIIATAKTRSLGVFECIEKKIVSSTQFYYGTWCKDDNYVRALNAERTRIQGDMQARALRKFEAYQEKIDDALIAQAMRKGPRQTRFMMLYYWRLEALTGQRFITQEATQPHQIHLHNSNTNINAAPGGTFQERLDNFQRERMRMLDEMNVEATGHGANGSGNGHGNGEAHEATGPPSDHSRN